NYFHSDELSRAEQIGFELLHQSDLSAALTRAVNVLIGYIKVKKAWQYYQKARQSTGNEEDAKILYRQAADLARDGVSVFGVVLREYRRNPQDSRQIARAWTGLSSIERTFILSTQELLKMEKSRKTAASMRLEITGRAVQALHAAVQSLLTAKARGNDASYQHSLEKSYLPLWNEENALDKILDGFVREGVGTLEDRPIQILQKNLDQLEILLKGKTLWNENYNPVVPAADPKVQHLLAQIQILRDWINLREETKQKITTHAKDLASGDYAGIDTFKKELELFVVEDLKKSPVLAKIPEPASHENRLQEFFQDVYAAFADLSLEELYTLKGAVRQSAKRKSGLFHTDDIAEIAKSADDDLGLLLENHIPLTLEAAARMIQTPFFKAAGFSLEHLPASQTVPPSAGEKQAIAPYSDKDVLKYGENDPKRFETIVTLSKKLSPWAGPARSAATQKIQDEARKQLDFFLEEYQKWKKHDEADRKSPERLTPDQARRVKENLYNHRMEKGYYPMMMELERMNKNDSAFVQAYLQTGHAQGREAGITLQKQEDAPMADSPLLYHGLARIRHYQDFLKAFYRHTGFSWAAIAVQEMKEIEQTLLRIRDSEKDPDYLSFEAYQTEIQKANGIYLEVNHYQQTNGAKIEKMLATVTALKETLGKARELTLTPEQKAIFADSLARLGIRADAVSRRLQNIPREPGYWDRTQEAKRMAAVAEKLLNQAAFLLKSAQRIQELQKTLRSQKELLERDGLPLEPSIDSPDKNWFQKTKTAGEELAEAQKLFLVFQEERFDEKKIDIFRSKLAGLDQKISPSLETISKLTAGISQIKKELILDETLKAITLWSHFIENFILKVFPDDMAVKKLWQEINKILSDFAKGVQKQDSILESTFELLDAIDKAIEIDDYQKIENFREVATKIMGQFRLSKDELMDKAAVRLALKKDIFFSVRKTSYGMPQEPQIAMNPGGNIAQVDPLGTAGVISMSYSAIAGEKIFEAWSFFDNEDYLRAYRHELLSFALTFSFYAQMLEGRYKGFSIPDAHAVLEKNFALAFKRQRDYLESEKRLVPPYLAAFDQVRQRAEKQSIVPRDARSLPLSGSLEQQIEAVFDSFAPEEIFRRIDFTQSLMKAEDSHREIPPKVVQKLLAEIPQID
ncbi:MAG TPA: hypothetical protein VJC08_00500, partial [bacterium]|nr:hypothetical protein [bacterium]